MSLRAQRPSAIVIYTVFEKDTVSSTFSFSSSIHNGFINIILVMLYYVLLEMAAYETRKGGIHFVIVCGHNKTIFVVVVF